MAAYWITSLIGLVIVVLGATILIRPLTAVLLYDFFGKKIKRIYTIGVIRVIMGISLLFLARSTKAYFFVITLGIIIFTSGLLVFFMPQDKIMSLLSYCKEKPSYVFRILSFIPLAVGFGLLYSAF